MTALSVKIRMLIAYMMIAKCMVLFVYSVLCVKDMSMIVTCGKAGLG